MNDPEKEDARALPNSEKSERSILSTMMQEPDGSYVDRAVEFGITKDSFYIPAHALLFQFLVRQNNKGIAIELVSLSQGLKDVKAIENIGGNSALAEIYRFQPTDAYFESHCKIVKDKERLREVISKSMKAAADAYENPDDVDNLLDSYEKEVFSISRGYQDQKTDFRHYLERSIENFEGFVSGKYEIDGLPTRFKVLNEMTRGLRKGDMIIVAARPSVGKTALMCNLIEDLGVSGIPGAVFSCEMTSQQVSDRILYARAEFPMHYLKKGFQPTRDELRRISDAVKDLKDAPIFIDDTPAISVDEVRAKCRRLKKEHDIQYAAFDYLQLMTSGAKKYEGREREIAQISAGLKGLAKELQIPVIVLAQLNRGPEKRQGNVPKMSDLRESGATEQDADIIGLLYRPDYHSDEDEEESSEDSDSNKNVFNASLIIAKNRNGPTGSVDMKFQKDIMKFK